MGKKSTVSTHFIRLIFVDLIPTVQYGWTITVDFDLFSTNHNQPYRQFNRPYRHSQNQPYANQPYGPPESTVLFYTVDFVNTVDFNTVDFKSTVLNSKPTVWSLKSTV